MKLIEICKECKKPLEVMFEIPTEIGNFEFYKCGHYYAPNQKREAIKEVDYFDLDNKDQAYDYQKTGYEFARASDFNCGITDAMGLGKTIQAELCLKNHPEELLPSLVLVKSATIGNWAREIHKWVSRDFTAVYPIIGKQAFIPLGFQQYLISMDSLKTNYEALKKFHNDMQPFKSVIVDECHSFKDDGSQRTKSLIKFLSNKQETTKDETENTLKYSDKGFIEGKYKSKSETEAEWKPIEHRIFLSGTPIKNKADEYFVMLNLLKPRQFSSRARFRRDWLQQNEKGVWTRVRPHLMENFQTYIDKIVIRREKIAVLKNLPPFSRHFDFVDIDDPAIKNSYNRELGLTESMRQQRGLSPIEILGALQRLRQITGIAKIQRALEFSKEFFEGAQLDKMIDPNYPDKLAIGIHHVSVRETLKNTFNLSDSAAQNGDMKYGALTLSGEDDPWAKDRIVNEFSKPEHKVLVVNELAGGVGLNLQTCANTLVLERQWNAADEEQFESRFHRNGQTYPVTATYIVANGTIDEFFYDLVEEKRAIFGETISDWSLTEDGQSLKSLLDRAIDNPLR